MVEKDSWIFDGNYGGTIDIRLKKADAIIFLDIPRTICVYRVIKRWIQYRNRTRPDMGEGCEERISIGFLKWVWEYPQSQKPMILKKLASYSNKKEIIVLHSPSEVEQFLNKVEEHVQGSL